ncbi:hypothetical protein A2982_03780 [candidate division WWE3 bacterium RIFCSPLOWO2_01_FULL_39_13]|uniref:AbiEi antitoxin C-terminal domain-containing protein n=1 Tax=candidate division WWE3 bacterium RIFCSPLOWO2_01_FULL_39_13 TaxID=1802624 RepID=A0A1F4V404_UNCKA|nr:MAG: hypothetical protein A2982_03780 [candidate division WWE3 bacterium RIFCSPLOWO2_01_FULL_39_13]
MNWIDLRHKAQLIPIFSINDVLKWFPEETENQVSVQLSRFVSSNQLSQLRNGLYLLTEYQINNPFLMANAIRDPSYISLETALNYYGLIPDIPSAVTSVTIRKTKTYETPFSKFIYRSIKPDLFFGFEFIRPNPDNNMGYNLALPEKALLDYLQLNPHINSLKELRLRKDQDLNQIKMSEFAKHFAYRVQNLVNQINENE